MRQGGEEREGCQSTGELWGLRVTRLPKGSLVGVLWMGGATDTEALPTWRVDRKSSQAELQVLAGEVSSGPGSGKCLGDLGSVPTVSHCSGESMIFPLCIGRSIG